MDKQEKDIVIFNGELAKIIIDKGYELVTIQVNRNNPDRTVFFFKRTNELLDFIAKRFRIFQ